MRGKVLSTVKDSKSVGITPAYAGKRTENQSFIMGIGDHPRLCGEKLLMQCTMLYIQRITPAYAGKSYGHNMNLTAFKDHPRLCGEKKNTRLKRFDGVGSPPPMRGKVRICLHIC